ncbi:hypothetical protein FRZ40_42650 [Paraburkholderia azotifigens]|uniref:Uncharacterized protein n=1 Tax=Paraburkholderia azotifigens TaxID=2057004 RepID=A0A5C6V8U3_9BURK|nr:hypothetical protein FRZ40_42650 [Paraburkholderia azotifigens]
MSTGMFRLRGARPFSRAASEALTRKPAQTMLTPGIFDAYCAGKRCRCEPARLCYRRPAEGESSLYCSTYDRKSVETAPQTNYDS